jgi:hypothetical protein
MGDIKPGSRMMILIYSYSSYYDKMMTILWYVLYPDVCFWSDNSTFFLVLSQTVNLSIGFIILLLFQPEQLFSLNLYIIIQLLIVYSYLLTFWAFTLLPCGLYIDSWNSVTTLERKWSSHLAKDFIILFSFTLTFIIFLSSWKWWMLFPYWIWINV